MARAAVARDRLAELIAIGGEQLRRGVRAEPSTTTVVSTVRRRE